MLRKNYANEGAPGGELEKGKKLVNFRKSNKYIMAYGGLNNGLRLLLWAINNCYGTKE